uniref:Uncharacterized protein n=1 Tax=Triticum urartu TaxID=4572 RepID=A0A8R7Q598_TRIUA
MHSRSTPSPPPRPIHPCDAADPNPGASSSATILFPPLPSAASVEIRDLRLLGRCRRCRGTPGQGRVWSRCGQREAAHGRALHLVPLRSPQSPSSPPTYNLAAVGSPPSQASP